MLPAELSALGVLASAHFGLMTFVPLSDNFIEVGDGTEDINLFNPPSDFSWDQWMDVAIDKFDAKGLIVTSKHVDGMTLFPSAATPARTIAATDWYMNNGHRNLFKEFVDAGRARGKSVGAYFAVGDSYITAQAAGNFTTYANLIKAQLTEVLSYGVDYITLDAWGSTWPLTFTNIPYLTFYNHIKSIDAACLVAVNDHDDSLGDYRVHEGGYDGERKSGYTAKPVVFWRTIDTAQRWFSHSDSVVEPLQPAAKLAILAQHRMRLRNYVMIHNISPGPDGLIPAYQLAVADEMQDATVTAMATGLQNHWTFDGVSGSSESDTALDHNYDGTQLTSLSKVGTPGSTSGIIGNARTVSSSNRFIDYSHEQDLEIDPIRFPLAVGDRSFTFTGWINNTVINSFDILFGKDHNSGVLTEYLLTIDSSVGAQPQWRVSNNGTNLVNVNATSFGNITAGVPWHFCVGHDHVNDLIFIQINGGARDTHSHSLGVAESISAFTVSGRDTNGNFPMTGWVDDLTLYMDRVVTTSEATAMYNGGLGLAITEYTRPVGPVTISKVAIPHTGNGIDLTGATFTDLLAGAGNGISYTWGRDDILLLKNSTSDAATFTLKLRPVPTLATYHATIVDPTVVVAAGKVRTVRLDSQFADDSGNVVLECSLAGKVLVLTP